MLSIEVPGHKKPCVLVCSAAYADGTKLNPMIVFKCVVRECKVLCQEF